MRTPASEHDLVSLWTHSDNSWGRSHGATQGTVKRTSLKKQPIRTIKHGLKRLYTPLLAPEWRSLNLTALLGSGTRALGLAHWFPTKFPNEKKAHPYFSALVMVRFDFFSDFC